MDPEPDNYFNASGEVNNTEELKVYDDLAKPREEHQLNLEKQAFKIQSSLLLQEGFQLFFGVGKYANKGL